LIHVVIALACAVEPSELSVPEKHPAPPALLEFELAADELVPPAAALLEVPPLPLLPELQPTRASAPAATTAAIGAAELSRGRPTCSPSFVVSSFTAADARDRKGPEADRKVNGT
jgi:hypothetical protein